MLLGCGLLAYSTSGCVEWARRAVQEDSGASAGTCAVDIASGSKPCPAKPEPLTTESVVSYVREYEYAHTHNQLDSSPQVNVNCNAALEQKAERGFYVMVACGGSAYGPSGSGDKGKVPVIYYVDGETTLRVGNRDFLAFEQPYHSDNASKNIAPPKSGSGADFTLYNFDDEDHTVSVEISYVGSEQVDPVVSEEYRINAVSQLVQREISVREGRHRMRASMSNGSYDEYTWELTSRGAPSWQSLAVVVTRQGPVQIWMSELSNVM